jgi:D-alanyl-lipoteichoic acid acyltransferase DltB (MBOAT superfamily)
MVRALFLSREMRLPRIVIALGLAAIGAAFAGDILQGELHAMGSLQTFLAITGLLVITVGGVLGTPIGATQRARFNEIPLSVSLPRGEMLRFGSVAAKLGVLVLLIWLFKIESPAFYYRVVPLMAGGFVIHHLLHPRARLAFFAMLCLASVWLVFGWQAGTWLVGVGLFFIALCHLPVRFSVRVGIVLTAAIVLALMRSRVVGTPWPGAIWPVLGSMFMFRLIAYLYDLKHQKEPVTWSRTIAYFFVLPNVAFPLFPVVDFSTFKRTYYDQNAYDIYERGIVWATRGLTHLILYRLIYQYATISPASIGDTVDLVRYILANFGLYLRVSGQFHLIVGLLHLFGFRLPETHRLFYLSSSFTDFWRRINIYWKEFMQKVVFNPSYFRLRKRWGDTGGLVAATLLVFAATWFLHSYQWYWLLGTWLWSATDTVFWGVLAVFLVVNSLREVRRGRTRSLGEKKLSAAASLKLGVRTALTFATIALLWALWTSPTMASFTALFATATFRPVDIALIVGVLVAVGVAAVVAERLHRPAAGVLAKGAGSWRALAISAAPVAVLWIAGMPGIAPRLGPAAGEIVRDVRVAELNKRDADELQRGYYENIVGVNRFNGQLWEVYSKKSASDWKGFDDVGLRVTRRDALETEIRPLMAVQYHGSWFRTNRWGMRDRDYEKAPAATTFRIAMLGQSYVMGDGVGDGESFESLIEERLNRERVGKPFQRYEILNFASQGYSLLQQLTILQNGRVLGFQPDLVIVAGHPIDVQRIGQYLVRLTRNGIEIPWEEVRRDIAAAGVTREMTHEEGARRLKPYTQSLALWAMKGIVQSAAATGAQAIYALVPTPNERFTKEDGALTARLAQEAGFDVIDLGDLYDNVDAKSLWVAEWDRHPNQKGHQLIAERLFDSLMSRSFESARHNAMANKR